MSACRPYYRSPTFAKKKIDGNATPAIRVGWRSELTAGIITTDAELFKLWGRIEAAVKLPSQPLNSPTFAKESINFC
jgi:hypothetical protein